MSRYKNLIIEQGESWEMTIQAKRPDGTVINLTGYTIFMKMKKSYHATETINFSTTVINAATGMVKFSIDSGGITPVRYVYDCFVKNGGTTIKLLYGIVSVIPSVSI